MPALSPTMTEGKIVKWLVKEGDKVEPGDAIAEVETDKATIGFEVQEKGFIAKINLNKGTIPIGDPVVVLAKQADEVGQFSSYEFGKAQSQSGSSKPSQAQDSSDSKAASSNTITDSPAPTNSRLASSPLAKAFAKRHGVEISEVKGSGPGGRVIKQDVDEHLNAAKIVAAKPK